MLLFLFYKWRNWGQRPLNKRHIVNVTQPSPSDCKAQKCPLHVHWMMESLGIEEGQSCLNGASFTRRFLFEEKELMPSTVKNTKKRKLVSQQENYEIGNNCLGSPSPTWGPCSSFERGCAFSISTARIYPQEILTECTMFQIKCSIVIAKIWK